MTRAGKSSRAERSENMARAYFLHQIKQKKYGTWDKGIVVIDCGVIPA